MSASIVWVLLGQRMGDNAQALQLADSMARRDDCEVLRKKLVYNEQYRKPNIELGATLDTLILGECDSLELERPPDMLIFTGRRAVPVARWIQEQAGPETRLVAIGKPQAPLTWFDLVISTRQYRLPRRIPNLIINNFTLNRARTSDAEFPDSAAHTVFRQGKPVTVVLLGASRSNFRLNEDVGLGIAKTLKKYRAANPDGALCLAASGRTPEDVFSLICRELGPEVTSFSWDDASKPSYMEMLHRAAALFVTEDSASMLTEAVSTGRPVFLLRLPLKKHRPRRTPRQLWIEHKESQALARGEGSFDREVWRFSGRVLKKGWAKVYRGGKCSGDGARAVEVLGAELERILVRLSSLLESKQKP